MKLLASVACVCLVAVPATAQDSGLMLLLKGGSLEQIVEEASRSAFASSEKCWRVLDTPEGRGITRQICQQIADAADRYETVNFAVLRARYNAERSRK